MEKYISIDVGGTAIKFGILDRQGIILEKDSVPTDADKGGPEILNKVIHIIDAYKRNNEINGICISTAGMVDVEKGEIFYAGPTIPNYKGTRYKEILEQKFSIPCEVENDVNCAGLAESVSGAAVGSEVTLCLTVGTGIGGCILINGKVFHGYSSSACEVGYMNMPGGDFQTLGSASVLTQKVAERKKEHVDKWTGLRIFKEAKAGDPVCICAIDEMTEVLGAGIANICYVLNPQTIVLGGGIMAQEDFLKERIEKAMKAYLLPSLAEKTSIVFAKHKNDAGMLGAFYHFVERQKK